MPVTGYQFTAVTTENLDELVDLCTRRMKANSPILAEGLERRRNYLAERIDQGWGAVMVQYEGTVVGFVDFLPLRATTVDVAGSAHSWFIQCLCMEPAHRGIGLEDQLLQMAEDEVRARGANSLVAVAYDRGDRMPLPFFLDHHYEELENRDELHLVVKWFGEPLKGKRQRPHWLSVRQRLKHGMVVVTSDLCPFNLYTISSLNSVIKDLPGAQVRVIEDDVRGAGRLTHESLVYAGGVLVAVGPTGKGFFRRALCPTKSRFCNEASQALKTDSQTKK